MEAFLKRVSRSVLDGCGGPSLGLALQNRKYKGSKRKAGDYLGPERKRQNYGEVRSSVRRNIFKCDWNRHHFQSNGESDGLPEGRRTGDRTYRLEEFPKRALRGLFIGGTKSKR